MSATYTKHHSITIIASVDIPAWRFVTLDGLLASMPADAVGISEQAVSTGTAVSAVTGYSCFVECEEAIPLGSLIKPAADGSGRAAVGTSNVNCGRAMSAASAAGRLVEVRFLERVTIEAVASSVGVDASTGELTAEALASQYKFIYFGTFNAGLRTRLEFERRLSIEQAVLNGSSDDAPGTAAAIATMYQPGRHRVFSFPEGALATRWNSPVSIDRSLVSVKFNGMRIVANGLSAGQSAMRFTGSEKPVPNANAMSVVSEFMLVGPGELTDSVGVNHEGDASADTNVASGPSRSAMEHFAITQFGEGVRHSHHSYAELVQHGAIWDCNKGVGYNTVNATAVDMGESTTYFKVLIYQCAGWAFFLEGVHGTWLKVIACNLDHNGRQIYSDRGARIELLLTHIEAHDYVIGTPFLIKGDGGEMKMIGGEMVMTWDGGRGCQYIVDCQVPRPHGGVEFNGVSFYKVWTASDYFATGPGIVRIKGGYTTGSTRRSPVLLHALDNLLSDGGFETSARGVQITRDGAAITNALNGSNGTVAQINNATNADTAYTGWPGAVGGTGYLEITKTGAVGTPFEVSLRVKIKDPAARGTFRARLAKGTTAGSLIVRPAYVETLIGANGMMLPLMRTASEAAIVFSNTTNTYQTVKTAGVGIAAAWTALTVDEYWVALDLDNFGPGDKVRIDNAELALM